MKKPSLKILVLFILFILIAGTAMVLIFWQGIRPFFVKEKISLVADNDIAIQRGEARLLDGVYMEKGEVEKYPVAVLIDNKYEARPQAGLSYAGLVFEAPVEGGITRILAIYSSDKELEKIGPIRSARPYFVDYANGVGAIMAHSGGSPEALGIIANDKVLKSLDLNEFSYEKYFWRTVNRIAPHNLYTSKERLDKARVLKLDIQKPDFSPWKFKDDLYKSERGEDGSSFKINFSYSDIYNPVWEYDAQKNIYKRKVKDEFVEDENDALILAKNIAVIKTDIWIIDSLSRRKITTIGEGDALVFQDGNKIEARWKKLARDNRLKFYDLDGKEISFVRGTTWVEVVSDLADVEEIRI